VITLLLFSVVMAALAGVFISSTRQLSGLSDRQQAAALATQALEVARSVSVTPDAGGCVPILRGRTQSAVTAQWTEAPPEVDLSGTDAGWAPAGCPGTVVLPTQGLTTTGGTTADPVVMSGQGYTLRTDVGTCRLPTTGGTCVQSASAAPGPVTLYRVIAAVTWRAAGACTTGCTYAAATLSDPSTDPRFDARALSTYPPGDGDPPPRPRPGGPGRPDNGYTVIEMVTVLFVVSVLLAAQASAVRLMTSVTTRLRSTGDALTQSRAATDALSRSMPHAERANMPGQVGTTWYVETLTTAIASGASPACAQWRLDTAADLLQVRTWTQGSSSASAWTTVARDVTTASCLGTANRTWTVNGDTGARVTGYTILDSQGRCLGLGAPNTTENTGTAQWSTIVVAPCDGNLAQKWNAPPDVVDAGIRARREATNGR
jgi:type II secretory pathway pseudopilin PulG